MTENNSSIITKTTLKVNLVLLVFLIAGGFGVVYFQKHYFEQLVTMEEVALEEELFNRGKILSQVGSRAVGKIIEEAIDNTSYGIDDFFDVQYQEIPGFDPPKYHTKVDAYLDKAILSVEDEFLKDSDLVYAMAADINGYIPTHNTKYQQAPTGDKQRDLAGNRTKRIFNDPIGIKAAKNMEQGLKQIYYRDTGEVIWDISSPIMVKGKHWGGFRVAVDVETIKTTTEAFRAKTAAIRNTFRNTIMGLMAGILMVSLVVVYLAITLTMAPLVKLTAAANDLADGQIETKINKTSSDELGQLADVLERLRLSLKKSMEKLRKR